MNNTKQIKVADIRKTFNTVGELRYLVVFMVCDGNWCIERYQSLHKSEKSAIKKLEASKSKYEYNYAPSFIGNK